MSNGLLDEPAPSQGSPGATLEEDEEEEPQTGVTWSGTEKVGLGVWQYKLT